ncbi:MAG: radical SAM protein [Planctomycetota bacterium]|jgi:organic radical activating enzyme
MKNPLIRNCCDGLYNSFDVHFTSDCDNRCAHCIDMRFSGSVAGRPDVKAISQTIIRNAAGYADVLFLGGEPCLYMDELIECIRNIRTCTDLEIFVTTAVPKTCHDDPERFLRLIDMVDGMNLSVQHYNETIADRIRQTESKYARQRFYLSLPKDKLRINLNLVRPYLSSRLDIIVCVGYYSDLGFRDIKLSEIQHGSDKYVSFEQLFDIKLKSPYYGGCQQYVDVEKLFNARSGTKVLLKRSCFLCEETLKASPMDGLKAVVKLFHNPKNKYGVVYADGTLSRQWK